MLQIIEAEMPQCFKFLLFLPPKVVVVYARQALPLGIALLHDADAYPQRYTEYILIFTPARYGFLDLGAAVQVHDVDGIEGQCELLPHAEEYPTV